jgi:hypothetical protein
VRYEGIASPPLTLVVRAEGRSTEADAAEVANKVQEHIKTVGSYRDRGRIFDRVGGACKGKIVRPPQTMPYGASQRVQRKPVSGAKNCVDELVL